MTKKHHQPYPFENTTLMVLQHLYAVNIVFLEIEFHHQIDTVVTYPMEAF